jgi:ATP-dependent Clp protease ATP-binding subunit ClpA
MKPRHSSSLILAWRVAEVEARRLNAQEIEPVHLLIGLCKIVDLDLPAVVLKDTPDRDEILEELLREVRKLRTVLSTAQVDARAVRRKLRGTPLGQRFQMAGSKALHRSPATKKIFADAEHFASLAGSIVFPAHLLYAVLLHEDQERDASLQALDVDKRRFREVARREVLSQSAAVPPDRNPKTTWN